MIALSGVRSSWLMLARNSLLWRLAASSWRLLSSISWNSRAFWIAIAAWSAKVLSRLDLLVGERRRRHARDVQVADAAALPAHRREHLRVAAPTERAATHLRPAAAGRRRAARRRNAARAARPSRAPSGSSPPWHREHRLQPLARRRGARRGAAVAVAAQQDDALLRALEQVAAALEDLVEHRRGVGHRAADHAQHLGGGGLLFERLLAFR